MPSMFCYPGYLKEKSLRKRRHNNNPALPAPRAPPTSGARPRPLRPAARTPLRPHKAHAQSPSPEKSAEKLAGGKKKVLRDSMSGTANVSAMRKMVSQLRLEASINRVKVRRESRGRASSVPGSPPTSLSGVGEGRRSRPVCGLRARDIIRRCTPIAMGCTDACG